LNIGEICLAGEEIEWSKLAPSLLKKGQLLTETSSKKAGYITFLDYEYAATSRKGRVGDLSDLGARPSLLPPLL